MASGLKVNLQKSRFLASRNVARTKVDKFASICGFHGTKKLDRYLGFPLLSGRVKKCDFDFILDHIQGRLTGWKMNMLSCARRTTLAKSVLNSIPIYHMQNLWLPTGVCDEIDRVTHTFIWGYTKNHWVKWDVIIRPRNRGGLSIRTTREVNVALLGKYMWDLLHEPNKLRVSLFSTRKATG